MEDKRRPHYRAAEQETINDIIIILDSVSEFVQSVATVVADKNDPNGYCLSPVSLRSFPAVVFRSYFYMGALTLGRIDTDCPKQQPRQSA
jgi:hypothetical protein